MRAIKEVDIDILMMIRDKVRRDRLDKVMVGITSLGDSGALWIVTAFILLMNKQYKRYGELMICSLMMCVLVGNIFIKNIVRRRRPFDGDEEIVLLISKPKDFSFPSAHTMSSFASAICLFYMNVWIGIIAIIIASLIAFSRMYLYVHFPSDILAGAIIGIIISIVSINILF